MRRDERRAILIEAATTAWRPQSPSGELRSHPAWSDLDPALSDGLDKEPW